MFRNVKSNNSGQALVEYVLILVVTLALLSSLSTLVFKPFQTYIKSIMGDYIECLLDTGELPILGDPTSSTECTKQFRAATDALGNSAGNIPKTEATENNSNKEDKESKKEEPKGSNSSAASSGGKKGNNIASSRPTKSAESTSGDGKRSQFDLPEGNENSKFFNTRTSDTIIIRRKKRISTDLGGQLTANISRNEALKKRSAQSRLISSSEIETPIKKMELKKSAEKPKVADEAEPLSFGDFIRILFIAAIIIALFLLIGGQALQMSKSD